MTAPPALPNAAIDVGASATDTRRLATRGNLEKAGKEFEAVFTKMMLKSMRQTHLADDIFSNNASKTFRDMQDDKIAALMADAKPLGIGKALTKFLAQSDPALSQPSDNDPRAIGAP